MILSPCQAGCCPRDVTGLVSAQRHLTLVVWPRPLIWSYVVDTKVQLHLFPLAREREQGGRGEEGRKGGEGERGRERVRSMIAQVTG